MCIYTCFASRIPITMKCTPTKQNKHIKQKWDGRVKIVGPYRIWKGLVVRRQLISTHWSLCGVVIVNFEHISHLSLVLLLLSLNMYLFAWILNVDQSRKLSWYGEFMGGVLKSDRCPIVWVSNYLGNRFSVEILWRYWGNARIKRMAKYFGKKCL